jgi:hypothetical protein
MELPDGVVGGKVGPLQATEVLSFEELARLSWDDGDFERLGCACGSNCGK